MATQGLGLDLEKHPELAQKRRFTLENTVPKTISLVNTVWNGVVVKESL